MSSVKQIDVLIGTNNPSKLARFSSLISDINGVRPVSLQQAGVQSIADEPFLIAEENAIFKARYYGDATGMITLAVDDSVTTNFLEPDQQPGVFLRRIGEGRKELSDDEIIIFWKDILAQYQYHEIEKKFYWNIGVAYYNPAIGSLGSTTINTVTRVAESFSENILDGYPMGSFLIPDGEFLPYADLSLENRQLVDLKAFGNLNLSFDLWLKNLISTRRL